MIMFTNHQDFQSVLMNQANYYGEKKVKAILVWMSLSKSYLNLNLTNVCQSQEKQVLLGMLK